MVTASFRSLDSWPLADFVGASLSVALRLWPTLIVLVEAYSTVLCSSFFLRCLPLPTRTVTVSPNVLVTFAAPALLVSSLSEITPLLDAEGLLKLKALLTGVTTAAAVVTMTETVWLALNPSASVTVAVAECVPAAVNACDTDAPMALEPSSKLHLTESGSFGSTVVALAVKLTGVPVVTLCSEGCAVIEGS
jgi:hypothetical protein